MSCTLKYAEKMARHYIKKATELGTTEWYNLNGSAPTVQPSGSADKASETFETNDIPHDPNARRCRIANKIPTLEQALEFARTHLTSRQCSPEIVREWYDECVGSFWCDGEGNAIHNWARNLTFYANYYKKNRENKEPKSASTVLQSGLTNRRRPINWRPTDPKDIKGVF